MNQEAMTLLDYHIWANRQIWPCVAALSEEQYTQEVDYSAGSLFNQMFHLVQTDWWAIFTLKGTFPEKDDPTRFEQADLADRAALRAKWDELEGQLRDLAAPLSDDVWSKTVTMPDGQGGSFDSTVWEMLYATVNHGTNHRAQVLKLVDELGGETVEQGFYFYLMSR